MEKIYAEIQRIYAQRGTALETQRRDAETLVRTGDACVGAQSSLDARARAATAKWQAWRTDFLAAKAWQPWSRTRRPYDPTVRYGWYAWLHPRSIARRAMLLALWLLLFSRRLLWAGAAVGALIGLRFAIPWLFRAVKDLLQTVSP